MNFTYAGSNGASRSGADDWFTPGKFAALLALLIIACFPQVIFGQATFYFRDFQLFGYPLAYHHKEAFWRGEIPLWNPYNDCGIPFLAQWNTLTLYPLSLIYLLLPLPWSVNLFCLAHLYLAGIGMYFLAHRWTGNRLAAAAAGMVFAFNGLTWHSLMWPNDIAALGWMPWVVWLVERAWRQGGRAVAVGALAGAMQMLAGAPEVILLTWVFIGAMWLMIFLDGEIRRSQLIVRGVGTGLLVGGLAAAQLLPFLELLAHSHRDTSYGDASWSMPATGWANYLVPLFHCFASLHGVYLQHDQFWAGSYYVGIGMVALALVAATRPREWRVWFLAAVTLFSLLMALGEHGYIYPTLKKMVPQLGFMRFPIKFVVLATFTIPLLGALGLKSLRELTAGEQNYEWKRLGYLAVVLTIGVGVIVFFARQYPQAGDNPGLTGWNGIRSAMFLAAIISCLALIQRKPEARMQRVLQPVLMVLLWMDVFTHVPALSPTAPNEVFQPDVMRQYFAQHDPKWDAEVQAGNGRVMQTLASLNKMYWGGQEDPKDDVFGRRIALYDDINLLDHIPKLDGFYSMYLREMNRVITDLYESSNDVPRLKDFLGIARVNPPTNTLEWVRRDSYAPLVTAGQSVYFGDDAAALRFLFGPEFDGRKKVCLPQEAEASIHAINGNAVKIVSQDFSAERIRLQVDAAGPGMIVVAQAYYPAWHAYVDGQPTQLWRANYAFQALEVPAGTHQVEIIYQDKTFRVGSVLSLAALIGCGLVWVLSRRRQNANKEGDLP